MLFHATCGHNRAHYFCPIAGVGGLEGCVIVEGRRFYLDLLDGPVNVVGQRRQLQGIVGIPLRAQQPL